MSNEPRVVKVRIWFDGKVVAEEDVPGPLAVHKPAPAVKKQGKGGK